MGAGRERIVDTCDRARGLFVLKDPEGRETRAFMVPPGRERVWEFLRRLVETNDEHGDVELPRDYGAHFRNTTSQNETHHDPFVISF